MATITVTGTVNTSHRVTKLTVTATGFPPNMGARITIAGTDRATTVSNLSGGFSFTYNVPTTLQSSLTLTPNKDSLYTFGATAYYSNGWPKVLFQFTEKLLIQAT